MLFPAISQPNALPALIAISTAPRFSAGSAPGSPRQTGQTCVLGGAPNAVGQVQKILLRVRSWACTSSPMTGSQSASAIVHLLHLERAAFSPEDRERAQSLRRVRLEPE